MDGANGRRLEVAHVHYGETGRTRALAAALAARGHVIRSICAVGELEPRDPRTGDRRVTPRLLAHLAASAAHFGRGAIAHRWNTPYAFDVHSERARRLLAALDPAPDVVLQHGALFAPGIPPPFPYALLAEQTLALASEAPGSPDYGVAWRAREAAAYAGARAVCAASRAVAESLLRGYGLPRERVHLVGAGPAHFPAHAPRADDGRTVLLAAPDFDAAGGPALLEAIRLVRARHPKARLLVVGPGPRRLALPRGSVHLGPLAPEELAGVLAIATVFARPRAADPLGLPFLDALACGVPCVAARGPAGAPEAVEHGATGLVAAGEDPASLAAAVGALLSDLPRARAMGLAARTRAERHFCWERVAARVERALQAAAAPPRAEAAA